MSDRYVELVVKVEVDEDGATAGAIEEKLAELGRENVAAVYKWGVVRVVRYWVTRHQYPAPGDHDTLASTPEAVVRYDLKALARRYGPAPHDARLYSVDQAVIVLADDTEGLDEWACQVVEILSPTQLRVGDETGTKDVDIHQVRPL
jgi:hypothetical protein